MKGSQCGGGANADYMLSSGRQHANRGWRSSRSIGSNGEPALSLTRLPTTAAPSTHGVASQCRRFVGHVAAQRLPQHGFETTPVKAVRQADREQRASTAPRALRKVETGVASVAVRSAGRHPCFSLL